MLSSSSPWLCTTSHQSSIPATHHCHMVISIIFSNIIFTNITIIINAIIIITLTLHYKSPELNTGFTSSHHPSEHHEKLSKTMENQHYDHGKPWKSTKSMKIQPINQCSFPATHPAFIPFTRGQNWNTPASFNNIPFIEIFLDLDQHGKKGGRQFEIVDGRNWGGLKNGHCFEGMICELPLETLCSCLLPLSF